MGTQDPDLEWGYNNNTAQAPYYLVFACYPFPRTSRERANLGEPDFSVILPGVAINRGTSHRYSEDAPMMENMAQALGTVSNAFDVTQLSGIEDFGSLMAKVEETFTELGSRYQEDAFGQITSTMGRLELLTTEAGFLGSSKRKYNFNWNLKTVDDNANTFRANAIANTMEKLSMPVVGGFVSEGNIAQATRMRPPNIWTIQAIDRDGRDVTSMWLGNPKPCMLMQVLHALDNQSFLNQNGVPFSYNLVANFVELENVFNYNGNITSRSQFFNALGGGG
tara:strand:+ start:2458 stop:3294 length:837 start_codon:yes stop_codon:yes gene_type:complete